MEDNKDILQPIPEDVEACITGMGKLKMYQFPRPRDRFKVII